MKKIATILLLLVGLVPISAASCATGNDSQGGADGGADAIQSPLPSSSTPAMACDPQFCPAMGFGEPCCVSQSGPCGMDLGMGCIHVVPGNPDGG